MDTTHANGTPPMAPEIAAIHAKLDMIGKAFNQLGAAMQELLHTRFVCQLCYLEHVEAQQRNDTLIARGEAPLPLPPLNTASLIVNGAGGCLAHAVVGTPGQTRAGLIIPGRG